MTTSELSNGFDTQIAAYVSKALFGEEAATMDFTFDEYEKSLYLTQAQREFVISYYSGKNLYGMSFEEKELVREAIDTLVKTITKTEPLSEPPVSVGGNNLMHYFFTIPEELLWIVYEEVKFGECECDSCIGGKVASVIPATHDELHRRIRNPFRGATRDRVLRLNCADNIVELISDYPIGSYTLRYVEEPSPIILVDLPDDLSIEGETDEQTCLLPDIVHQDILDIAVKLAIQSRLAEKTVKKSSSNK